MKQLGSERELLIRPGNHKTYQYKSIFCIPQRVILSIMGFLAILNAYTMRICLSVAIIEMVKKVNNSSPDHSHAVCTPEDVEQEIIPSDSKGDYDWPQSLQGFILSSFYIGYIITHVPGAFLAEKYGGKWILSLGILSTAVFTILTPFVISFGHEWGLIILRILMGAGEGTTFPALSALLSAWVPPGERSTLGSLVLGGGQIGTVLGTAISGVLIEVTGSWTSVFYFFGGIGILWFLIFTALCYSSPQDHPFIKESEKEYLEKEVGRLERDKDLPPVPWRAILTSVPVIALIFAQIGHDWGFYIMVSDLPKYMADVLLFPIKSNGLLSSIPYLVMWIVSLSSGFLGDILIRRNIIGLTFARKMFTTVAAVGPAIFILLASYAGCDRVMVIVHFTLAMGLMGTYYPGMKVNPLDLSPNYAATLMAICNGIGAVTGVLAPVIAGLMTPNATLTEWRTVFWVSFVIFTVTSIIYIFGASADIQPWDNPTKDEQIENGKSEKQKSVS